MRAWMTVSMGVLVVGLAVDVVTAQPPDREGPARRPEARGPRGFPAGPAGPGRGAPRGDFRRPRFPLMIALDADEDGEISAEEIENAVTALRKLDKDEDGMLSAEELRIEFPGGPARGPGGRFGGPGGQFGGPGGQFGGPGGRGGMGRPGWRGGPEGVFRGPGGMREERGPNWRRGGERAGMRPGAPGRGDISVERLMALDRDDDGKVTKEELPEPLQRVLRRGDTDGDGAIDRAEAEKLVEQIERFRRDRPQGGPGGPGGPGGEGFVERMMSLDRDGDGKITREEMPEWMRARVLDRADANEDGALDREEAEKMAEEFQRRRGGPPARAAREGRADDDRPEQTEPPAED